MNKIILDDIMGLPAYEKARERFRQRVIELKKNGVFPSAIRFRSFSRTGRR